MQDPENLDVYRRSLDFAEGCARVSKRVSARDAPGLAAQLLRAATSVPANISEGVSQRSDRKCMQHLDVAVGSLSEALTWLELAKRLAPKVGSVSELVDEGLQLRKMTWSLRGWYERREEEARRGT